MMDKAFYVGIGDIALVLIALAVVAFIWMLIHLVLSNLADRIALHREARRARRKARKAQRRDQGLL